MKRNERKLFRGSPLMEQNEHRHKGHVFYYELFINNLLISYLFTTLNDELVKPS